MDAYDRMFTHGLVWYGLSRGRENGLQTIARISSENIARLETEIDTDRQWKVAKAIAGISLEDYSITHFSDRDFTSTRGVHFKTLVRLQSEKANHFYEGNSTGGNIPFFANHDFSFFALEAGAELQKTSSRFGTYCYRSNLACLGDKRRYGHLEVGDLLRPNIRQISEKRAGRLSWMRNSDSTRQGIECFKNRTGLKPDRQSDLLFYGNDMQKGLGQKVAHDLDGLTQDTQDVIVEWVDGDRPIENISEVINAFYRPQIAVPGGLELKPGQFSLTKYCNRPSATEVMPCYDPSPAPG